MRILLWLVRAALFFLLFAFALNNQHEAIVKGFFGFEWRGPMVVVVLASVAGGAALMAIALLPRLWRRRAPSIANVHGSPAGPSRDTPAAADSPLAPAGHPPRDGL